MAIVRRGGIGTYFCVIAGAAALAGVLGAEVARRIARRLETQSPSTEREIAPSELGVPYDEVWFCTSDGLRLNGWWLARAGAERTVVTMTGHHGRRSQTVGVAAALWERGANVLMFDYRGRGASDPSPNTLGYHETTDALSAVEYAATRVPGLPLGLVGYSMGGAVAIMAAEGDARVGAVVADSPFASQRKVIRRHFRARSGLPSFPLSNLMERFLSYDVALVEPIREIGRIAPRGVMLIHGGLDAVTDPLDSQRLYEAAGEPKEMWALPSVAHCRAYFEDTEMYVERIASFLARSLARA